ncbi:hypothetical protein [Pontiella sp.]|uniref:hypothetical protein n=1 Tax=Pontiella sp. TaxID=2837462 RepID=UPI00356246EA
MKKAVMVLLAVLVTAGSVYSSRKDEVTLVLLPRDDSVVRVGLDLFQRYRTLLVTYQVQPNGTPSLHGWTGKEWVNINPDAFRAGDFFHTGPDSALIVEEEGVSLPASLLPPESWCNAVYKITTTEVRPLLHLTGQYYDFKYKDWKWFSENYRMSMDAINPEQLNIAWYHRRLGENLKKGPVAADDLQYWVAVRHPLPPVEMAAEPEPELETNDVEAVESLDMEESDTMLLTNDIPEAVVLSPGDAREEAVKSEE